MHTDTSTKEIAQYRCPLCQQALLLNEKSYRCENNHSFDQAKQGYVNLLPVQFKHSKEPGDNKAMVQARRAFLDKGYYQPLLDNMLALKTLPYLMPAAVKVFIHINIKPNITVCTV